MNTSFFSFLGVFMGGGYLLGGTNGTVVGFTLACGLLVALELYGDFKR